MAGMNGIEGGGVIGSVLIKARQASQHKCRGVSGGGGYKATEWPQTHETGASEELVSCYVDFLGADGGFRNLPRQKPTRS
jgi:hypothetical protein